MLNCGNRRVKKLRNIGLLKYKKMSWNRIEIKLFTIFVGRMS